MSVHESFGEALQQAFAGVPTASREVLILLVYSVLTLSCETTKSKEETEIRDH